MAVSRTINFLPGFYQTQANRKFLSATLDQLVSEPAHTRLHGYVGRRTAPNYKSSDNYISEITGDRARYQLEPSVVVKDSSGNSEFVTGYQDLINKLRYSGVNTNNHSRLFGNEYYAYDGLFDFDKIVNFSQYYWLPNGPDSVNVFGLNVPISKEFEVTADYSLGGATVTGANNTLNPTITLARGGSYTFKPVGFNSDKIWIQTEPGTTGFKTIQSNISSREVLGVYGNGTNAVTFNVPESDAQDQYLLMDRVFEVDLATTLSFSQLQNRTFDQVIAEFENIDGQRNLVGKTIIFLYDGQDSDERWTSGGIFDDSDSNGYDSDLYDRHTTIPAEQRYGVWQISNDTLEGSVLKMTYVGAVEEGEKVFIREGITSGNREYYKNAQGRFSLIPVITATTDTLFYQDPTNASVYGIIKLVDPIEVNPINVDDDIIGRRQYVSPNGIEFTNGLKIRFDSSVTPEKYVNKTYYIEGVGSSIKLIDTTELVTPEPYTDNLSIGYDVDLYDSNNFETTLDAPVNPSYITINRGSDDLNPWTRSNRWFHQDVITATSKYNNYTPVIDQSARATRPIIEFNSNLQLFNFGKIGKTRVNVFDTVTTDAFSNVQNQLSYTVDGIDLTPGMRVIFAADEDESVRNKIYEVSFEDFEGTGTTYINLTLADDGEVSNYDNIIVTQGATLQSATFWFNGYEWVEAQRKTSLNQTPLFDVYDSDGYSLSDADRYPNSTFAGTKIFSYKENQNSTVNDSVLGFPLTYRNFSNIGDIVFENNYDTQVFGYTESNNTVSKKVSSGYLHVNTDAETYENRNVWTKINKESRQYQTFTYTYEGDNKFLTGLVPDAEENIPNTLLYVNNNIVSRDEYEFIVHKTYLHLEVNKELELGDRVVLYVYSDAPSQYGYYQVPSNLDNNSVNDVFDTLTLGQLRNNVKQAFESSVDSLGVFPGASNIRDIRINDNPGGILQHSAPLTYAMLFLTHPTASFEKSVDYANREYTRFKNKLMERAIISEYVSENDIPGSLDLIVEELSSFKTTDMPWYASDMLPWGDDYTEIKHIVTNELKTQYELSEIFDITVASNQAVIVYVNGVQLLHGIDYKFAKDAPAIEFDVQYDLALGDEIVIREYTNTDGSWIPETPSKLGLYPAYEPRKFVDSTFREPQEVIQGHDGSITIAFGDFRDDLLIEFEKRIFNNIKARYDSSRFDINSLLPGKFRDTSFGKSEVDTILSKSFLEWAGLNRVDYINNNWYKNSDGFTWNYNKFVDKLDNEPLKGTWKSIYQYYFDTTSPDQRPWEMLGFSIKPYWWESEYGPAPYTSGNKVLWDDLEAGKILHGDRAGIDLNYARPGLSSIIPVNEYGELISPHEFIVARYEVRNSNSPFTPGDIGPVEAAWRRTSEYPYAVQKLLSLIAPAKFFGLQADTIRYNRETTLGQFVYKDTNQRIRQEDIKVNGEEYDGTVFRSAGYINWIADYTRSLGLSAEAAVGKLVRNFEVKLSYKMAGFSDKSMLKIFAEQASPTSTNESVLIPDEDFDLALTKSVPLDRLTYSAVIVTKTNGGWTVEGYDSDVPYFRIIPSDTSGKSKQITIAGISAVTYDSYQTQVLTIPYGYEFTSRQQVVEFLTSYERFLQAQGFRFNRTINELKSIGNWTLSAKEFLSWSTQGWAEGNVIVLSPVSNVLEVKVANASVDDINDFMSSGKLLDVNFRPLNSKEYGVSRSTESTEIEVYDAVIGFAELSPVQYEHVAVFNNSTVFNDVIYQPALGNRQNRLKIIGKKTANWDGTLYAPGYILNQSNVAEWVPGIDYKKGDMVTYKDQLFVASKNLTAADSFSYNDWTVGDYDSVNQGLLPNFANKAVQIEKAYELEDINLESDIDVFSKGLIGFRQRGYLNDIGIDDASQVKFYQGMIREKGTKTSIERLTSAQFDRLSSDIEFFEDWAFRVGDYGSQSASESIEIVLDEAKFNSTPTFLTLKDDNDESTLDTVSVSYSELHKRPRYWNKNLLIAQNEQGKDYNHEMKVAGFARMDDVDFTVFDITKANELDVNIDDIGANSIIWTAKDFSQQWNIYEVETTDSVISAVYNAGGGYVMLETADQHTFVADDVVIVKNISTLFDGFYRVKSVPELNQMLVQFTKFDLSSFESSEDLNGYVLKLHSRKYQYPSDIAKTEALTWRDGNMAWVEDTDGNSGWAVYEKTSPWDHSDEITDGRNDFGYAIARNKDGDRLVVATNDDGLGGGQWYFRIYDITETGYVDLGEFIAPGFARQGDVASTRLRVITYNNKDYIFIGRPDDSYGFIQVYSFDRATQTMGTQSQIPNPHTSTTGFGQVICVADDNSWNGAWVTAVSRSATQIKLTTIWYNFFGENVYGTNEYIFETDGEVVSLASSADGSSFAIGISGTDTAGAEDSGSVHVYKRRVETIVANGTSSTYVLPTGMTYRHVLYVNGVYQVKGVDYNHTDNSTDINFITTPPTGTIIKIVIDEIVNTQVLQSDDPAAFNKFGYSMAMSTTGDDLYVSSPGDDNELLSRRQSGEVYHYKNVGGSYQLVGTTVNPDARAHAGFGETLALSSDDKKLIIGCPASDMVIDMTIDGGTTVFDDTSTTLRSVIHEAGVAYVYQLATNPVDNTKDSLVFGQRITDNNVATGDRFGDTVLFDGNNRILVTTPGTATIHTYTETGNPWTVKRQKEARVDVSSINNVYLYNYVSGEKLLKMDYIDPAKGKILGAAAQDIDYVSDIDPAYYNRGTSAQTVANIAWDSRNVGKVWWDTTNAVWLDYEQGSNDYRTAYWGKLFPGSEIKIYEWVESTVPPSQYEDFYNDGTPRSLTDYVVTSIVDPATGATQVTYYFWAEGATGLETTNRSLTTGEIAQAITNPSTYGIPYAAFVSQNTFGVYQVSDYLVNSEVVMHIGYDRVKNNNLLHSEYTLVQEGNALSKIPKRIILKMIDSLCGQNSVGFPVTPGSPVTVSAQLVPDPALPEAEKYGILYRPRQSVFKNRQDAMRLLIQMANDYFATIPAFDTIAQNDNFTALHDLPILGFDDKVYDLSELEYISITDKAVGFRVLVEYDANISGWAMYEKVAVDSTSWTVVDQQQYNVSKYWSSTNWYAPGFENIPRFSHTVETFNDLSYLTPVDGEIFKVNDGGNGKYSIYYYTNTKGYQLVGLQNSTVVFSDELWTNTPPIEARYILNGMAELLAGTEQMNHMLFALIRFALSEQKYLDWAFKTSFITILHKIRKLSQYANYQKDNQDFVMDYINEVKPYRTKIREYLLDYEGDDYWEGDVTDFDLPGYFDVDFGRFRSVSGERNKDPDYLDRPEHIMWRDNHTLYVSSIKVVDGGRNFDVPPQVLITGNGTGATAYAQIVNGSVSKIIVVNGGTGYTETPTIELFGGNGTGARLVAIMANDFTRKIATTIKFDRYTYDSNVKSWEENTVYTIGDVISHNGEAYQVVNNFTSGTSFEGINLEVIADETFENASDRTMAFYQPTKGMPAKDLKHIFSGIDYEGVMVNGAKFEEETNLVPGDNGQLQMSTEEFDSVIKSTFADLALGTRPEDINIDGGAFVDTWNSHAPEELVPGITFDAMDLQVYTLAPADTSSTAGYKIYLHTFRTDGVTKVFDVAIPDDHTDNVLVYSKVYGYQDEGVDFAYDRDTRIITFTTAPAVDDVIYMYLMTDSGVGKIYDNFLQTDGITTEFTMVNVPFELITDSLVIVNGIVTQDYTIEDDGETGTLLTMGIAPAVTDHVHVYFFSGQAGIKNYSEFKTQIQTAPLTPVYPVDYTVDLDTELLYGGPLSGNFIVEVNGNRLRPANNSYYVGDNSTVEFFIPTSVDIDPDVISDNDISVYVDGVKQNQYTDYNVVPSDGISLRSIVMLTAPANGTEVVISLQTGADFRMNSSNQLLIEQDYFIPPQSEIRVTTFSNHDLLKLRTQVFVGSTTEETVSEPGYDTTGFDSESLGWDGEYQSTITRPVYELVRPVYNTNYIWATLSGRRLLPNYDFVMRSPTLLELGEHLNVGLNDAVVVTTFVEDNSVHAIGYRVFKNMLDDTKYYRISDNHSTVLSKPLQIDDEWMYVRDASVLPLPSPEDARPGTVFVEGERITYYEIDYVGSRVGRLRRSTGGTGALQTIPKGSPVVDASNGQIVPKSEHKITTGSHTGNGITTAFTVDVDLTGISNYRPEVYVSGRRVENFAVTSLNPLTIDFDDAPPTATKPNVEIIVNQSYHWYDEGVGTATSGVGLMASTTIQANFLKKTTAAKQVISRTTTEGLGNDVFIQEGFVEEGYVYGNDFE